MNKTSPIKYTIIFFLFAIPLSTYFCGCRQGDSKEQLETSDDIEFYADTIPFLFENKDIFAPQARKIILKTSINEIEFYSCIDNGAPYTFLRIDLYHKLFDDSGNYENVSKNTILKSVDLNIKLNNFSLPLKTIALLNQSVGLILENARYDVSAIVGLDLFENYILKFDFIDKNMIVCNILPDEVRGFQFIKLFRDSVHIEKFRNLRRVNVDGFKLQNGETVSGTFFVDLGAHATIMNSNSRLYKEMDIQSTVVDKKSWAAKLISLTELHKGVDIHRGDPKTFEEMGVDGVIGMDFLTQFDLIFDYQNNMMYLKKN